MTERLRHIMSLLTSLPDERQDEIAAVLEAELAEGRRIAAQLADSSETDLDELLAEARREIAEGGARDLQASGDHGS